MSELIGSPRLEVARPELGGEVVVMADDLQQFLVTPGEDGVDEDTSVTLDVPEDTPLAVEDVVYELAVAAATEGREFDGELLAQLLEQGGPVGDVRLTIAIGVLRLGQKLTGDRMLRVLEGLGFEGEAMAGRLARDEIAKAGGVAVEGTVPSLHGGEP